MIYKTLWFRALDNGLDDKIEQLARQGWTVHTFVVHDRLAHILFQKERA